jgi:hypothetical protein
LEPPTESGIANLADAVASGGADFDACNRKGDANVLRGTFRSAAKLCSTVTDIDDLMSNYDASYLKRKRDIAGLGGTCLGDYKRRFDMFMSSIKQLRDTCRNE